MIVHVRCAHCKTGPGQLVTADNEAHALEHKVLQAGMCLADTQGLAVPTERQRI